MGFFVFQRADQTVNQHKYSNPLAGFLGALTYRRDCSIDDGPKDLHPCGHGLVAHQLKGQCVLENREAVRSHPPAHGNQHFASEG